MAGGAEGILLQIAVIILAAKIGGEAAERVHQPAVLGELLFGVIVGPSLLHLIGSPILVDQVLQGDRTLESIGGLVEFGDLHVIAILAEIGVILLLFEVGLESDIKDMMKVGVSSLFVAFLGVVVSFAAGFGTSQLLAAYGYWPDRLLIHIFIGATLTATSVGITARVLADMGKLASNDARIILGAAVIDDVIGLIILAIVAALAAGDLTASGIAVISATAIGFLAVALAVGLLVVPKTFDVIVGRSRVGGMTLSTAIFFMLILAYVASLVGLAPIVGAFAGGMILAQSKYRHQIFEQIRPLGYILVPFFFVVLGIQVDLSQVGENAVRIVVVGTLLSVVAIAAKLTAGLGVLRGEASRLVVGVGMAPRGEVGLIFALFGLSLGLIENWEYTAVIIVVMVTTFVTPIWLKMIQGRIHTGRGPASPTAESAAEMLRRD